MCALRAARLVQDLQMRRCASGHGCDGIDDSGDGFRRLLVYAPAVRVQIRPCWRLRLLGPQFVSWLAGAGAVRPREGVVVCKNDRIR